MRDDEINEFAAILTSLSQIYDKKLSKGALRLYWNALSDLSMSQFRQGISRHVNDPQHGTFWPKPADIRRHLEGDPETRALEAWSKFVEAAERHGGWKSVVFDDPAIHQVIHDMGGWQPMSSWSATDEPFIRREFVKRYQGVMQRPPERVPRLIGRAEAQNKRRGFDHQEQPALVGDVEMAKQLHGRLEVEDEAAQSEVKRLKEGLKSLGEAVDQDAMEAGVVDEMEVPF